MELESPKGSDARFKIPNMLAHSSVKNPIDAEPIFSPRFNSQETNIHENRFIHDFTQPKLIS